MVILKFSRKFHGLYFNDTTNCPDPMWASARWLLLSTKSLSWIIVRNALQQSDFWETWSYWCSSLLKKKWNSIRLFCFVFPYFLPVSRWNRNSAYDEFDQRARRLEMVFNFLASARNRNFIQSNVWLWSVRSWSAHLQYSNFRAICVLFIYRFFFFFYNLWSTQN